MFGPLLKLVTGAGAAASKGGHGLKVVTMPKHIYDALKTLRLLQKELEALEMAIVRASRAHSSLTLGGKTVGGGGKAIAEAEDIMKRIKAFDAARKADLALFKAHAEAAKYNAAYHRLQQAIAAYGRAYQAALKGDFSGLQKAASELSGAASALIQA